MNIVTWNVRGLNKAYKQKELKVVIKENKIGLLAILEHRVVEKLETKIIQKIAQGWRWISNASSNNKGRTWIIWDPRRIDFVLLTKEIQYIHGVTKIYDLNLSFHFTAVYGLHSIQDRKSMWISLRSITQIQQGPWIIMGDFNTILHQEDRMHGSPVQEYETRDFREFLMITGFCEVKTFGREYTWKNSHTYSKIDRAIANADWISNDHTSSSYFGASLF